MIHAAGANGVYLQICHNKRFEFGFQRIEMLAAKTIGAVITSASTGTFMFRITMRGSLNRFAGH